MQEAATHYFNLESPAAGAVLPAGRSQLRGWLVGKPGTHFVDVRARVGPRIFPGVHGFPRPDLAAHFEPSRPWLPAEFTVETDLPPGPAEITLEALDLAGHWERFHVVSCTVQDTLTLAAPAPDAVTALEFGRAITAGFKAGQPIELPWPRVIRQDHLPFHGYLAQPEAVAPALYGRLDVIGWLFHEQQTIRRAFITTDLVTFQPLEFGGEFPGLKERFPGQARASECRFKGTVDVSTSLPGPASVRVFAELADGSTHLCLATHCQPVLTEELKAVWPPFAPLSFWDYWREAKRQLVRQGAALETGAPLRRQFWQLLREYRQQAVSVSDASVTAAPLAPAKADGLRLLLVTHNLNLEGAPLLFVEYAAYLNRHTGAKLTVLSGQDGPLRDAFAALGAKVMIRSADAAPAIDWAQVDLVVANTVASYWGVALAQAAGKPSLLYIHESVPPHAFKAFSRAELPLVAKALRHATAVSFNTPATRAYYEHLGSGRNHHLNPAWIDVAAIDAFRATHPREALRAQLGLCPDERLVANIGTVCERKGQHDFVRAIEWLWQSNPALAARCRFVLVGGRDTRYNRELRQDLAATGRQNVEVIAETTRAFDYFGAADVFVCTSYEESFPRVVLEAMAFEVPVVSTNVHGIPYMLNNDTEALLFGSGDIAALVSALQKTLGNPAASRARAVQARARVAEFSATALLPRHAAFTAGVAAT